MPQISVARFLHALTVGFNPDPHPRPQWAENEFPQLPRHFRKCLGNWGNVFFRIPITSLALGQGVRGWNPLLGKN